MDSNQSPTANGTGQFPEPPMNRQEKGEHPRSPQHGEEQGRDVPGFNHQGYAEAEVISPGAEQTETAPEEGAGESGA
jgi:hypothetical protein